MLITGFAPLLATHPAPAMQFKVVGDQLIASGPVLDGDFSQFSTLLATNPQIDTVILRNSPGGDAPTGYRVGVMLREKRLRTAVSGFCYSSCSRMFLGGASRHFTDDYPPELTHVGLHGHYGRDGLLLPGLVAQLGLKEWIIRYSDGRADAALVDRWINIPHSDGMIDFYNPDLLRRNDVSTFLCLGGRGTSPSIFDCEPIGKTAFDLGIATSRTVVKSNDQVQLRASVPH